MSLHAPNTPAFYYYSTISTGDSTYISPVLFNAPLISSTSFSSGNFTCPTTGLYFLSTTITVGTKNYNGNSALLRLNIMQKKTGVTAISISKCQANSVAGGNNSGYTLSTNCTSSLTAGDIIYVTADTDGPGTFYIGSYYTGYGDTCFQGLKIA